MTTKPGKPKAKKPAVKRDAAGFAMRAKRVAGQPTKYDAEAHPELAFKYCLLGATNEELARSLDVSVSTIDAWLVAHPEFSSAVKRGREQADAEVANRLYKRALGYEHAEDDIRALNGEIVITPTIKQYPPDTAAAIFWLKNRRSDKWREKVETALTGANGEPLSLAVTFVKPGECDAS